MYPYNPELEETLRESLLSVWGGEVVDTWIAVLAALAQTQEDTNFDVATALTLTSATGEALDKWGELVGEGRGTQDDLRYRRTILAKARALIARGTPVEIIEIANALTGGQSVISPSFPAGFRLILDIDTTLTDEERTRLRRILDTAIPAGVGDREIEAASFAFRLDDPDRGLDLGLFGRLL